MGSSIIWSDFFRYLFLELLFWCSRGDSSDSYSQQEMKRSRRRQKIVSSMGHSPFSSWDLWDSGEWLFLQGISQGKSRKQLGAYSHWHFFSLDQLRYSFSSGEDTTISLPQAMKSARRNEKELSSIPSSRVSSSSHPIAFSRILSISNSKLWENISSSLYWSSHQEWWWILSLLQMMRQNQWPSSWQRRFHEESVPV